MIKLFGESDILIIFHYQFIFINITDFEIKESDSLMNINVKTNFHLLCLSVPFLKIA